MALEINISDASAAYNLGKPRVYPPLWWDPNGEDLCVWAAYQPKGAADLASSYLDLSGNGNNCGPGVAPTWDAVNGWKFNGVDQYLVTTFVPQDDQSQSCLIQFTNLTYIDQAWLLSIYVNATRAFGVELRINKFRYWNGDDAYGVTTPTPSEGNSAIAGSKGYLDGGADTGMISAWGGSITDPVLIGCMNNAGTPQRYCNIYMQALAIYDCTLTAPQVLAIATAMAAL